MPSPDHAAADRARDAIYEKAAKLAEDVSDVDQLGKLAEAVSKLAYGPQGGTYFYSARYEGPDRGRTGFGRRDDDGAVSRQIDRAMGT